MAARRRKDGWRVIQKGQKARDGEGGHVYIPPVVHRSSSRRAARRLSRQVKYSRVESPRWVRRLKFYLALVLVIAGIVVIMRARG